MPSVELVCPWCGEEIKWGEDLGRNLIMTEKGPRLQHEECAFRSVMGGLNHQKRNCTCCGGKEPPDPPGMTRREAAKAAYDYWQEQRGPQGV